MLGVYILMLPGRGGGYDDGHNNNVDAVESRNIVCCLLLCVIKMVDDYVCHILRPHRDENLHQWLQHEPCICEYLHGHKTNRFYYPMLCCG